ncbi:hypothetical protein [Nocardioides nematodiphilus]|uniref:hypothetical protein n=1 Tax=Nocardioides nematodiphilus TaxID=2849669 RepID=UPI001CD9B1A7|nr:hypothetical protein [Nocardioides nematodiphilus]MCA1983043.1 hypothetical protein [Nocardioides nematodiphilus]
MLNLPRARSIVMLAAAASLPLGAVVATDAAAAGAHHKHHHHKHHRKHAHKHHHKNRHHHKKARAEVEAGVVPGTRLRSSGSVTVTTPGTVVKGLDINGTLTIAANNVTVKNTRVTSGSAYNIVKVDDSATGVTLDHVTVDGKGMNGTEGANGVYGPGTYNAVAVSGVENGFVPSSGATITGSWVHNLASPGSPHYDGIQIDGARSNITVKNSTVDLTGLTQTSAVMVDNYFGPATNINITGNRLLGAGYTVYADGQFNSNPITVTYANNRIGKGQWGYSLLRSASVRWSGNTDARSGHALGR